MMTNPIPPHFTESDEASVAPLISAIVCTHNRANFLEGALRSLESQSLAPDDYEVVVVDNASRDDTPGTAKRFAASSLIRVRYFYEPRVGVSHARNRGVSESLAPIVAFLDDDAEAGEEWLTTLLASFQNNSTRPLSVGGKVLPVWGAPRPSWLPGAASGLMSVRDQGEAARATDALLGCNLAFEKSFLLECGGFDPLLGRRARNLAGNEEVALLQEIGVRGGLIQYEPGAVVRHFIHPDRLRLSWVLRRSFDQGASDMMMAHLYPALAGRVQDRSKGRALSVRLFDFAQRLASIARSRRGDDTVLLLMDLARRLGAMSHALKTPVLRRQQAAQSLPGPTTPKRKLES